MVWPRRFLLTACLLITGGAVIYRPQHLVLPPSGTDAASLIGVRMDPIQRGSGPVIAGTSSDDYDLTLAEPNSTDLAIRDLGAFVRQFPSTQREAPLFQEELAHWVALSPGEALQWLHASGEQLRFSHLADAAASSWAEREPEAALAWAARSDSDRRAHLYARFAIGFASTDPSFAIEFAASMVPAGIERRHANEGIADVWAKRDPAGAASWALTLADLQSREHAISLVAYSWFERSPTAVMRWVSEIADERQRDSVRVRLIGWQMEKNPAAAASMLDDFVDGGVRAQATLSLVGHWACYDLKGATAWVKHIPSASLRSELQAELAATERERISHFR